MKRYLHISARLTTVMGPNNTPTTVVVRPGTTFNVGRNAEKRKARHREKLIRQADVWMSDAGDRSPKRVKSHLTVDMLSDRRLRQRQAA